jgi:hypothetical protein
MNAVAVSTGDGCASSIAGTTTLRASDAFTRQFDWSLNPATTVRPGERFTYGFGPLTQADIQQFGTSGTYSTRYRFTSAACP